MPQVLLINPPNSTSVLGGGSELTRPEELTDWANVACLGTLALASALADVPGVTPVYLDGTVLPWPELLRYLEDNADDLLLVGVSALTASYQAGLELLRVVKALRPDVVTVLGNDHFTALPAECLAHRPDCVDLGFVGNEVIGPFRQLVADLRHGRTDLRAGRADLSRYPGLAYRSPDGVVRNPQRPEPIPTRIDYPLIDAVFPHGAAYRANFAGRVGPMLAGSIGARLHAGVPVELGRGCIKFSRDDACTFCSIQYGGMWRNGLPGPEQGWQVLGQAFRAGYDYLSLTADELPLTFGPLLREMLGHPPDWWSSLPERDRPVLAGYARADGISDPRRAAVLRGLNVRYLMVGLDAGAPLSLSALNKPLAPVHGGDPARRAEQMFAHNVRALQTAREEGLLIKAGLVVGHLGMTRELLKLNVESVCALLDGGSGAIASVDIEVLSPEPGSTDHRYLLEPDLADAAASRLGLQLADPDVRRSLADTHRGLDLIDREQAMNDYVTALMPELTLADLTEARATIRSHCKATNIMIGE